MRRETPRISDSIARGNCLSDLSWNHVCIVAYHRPRNIITIMFQGSVLLSSFFFSFFFTEYVLHILQRFAGGTGWSADSVADSKIVRLVGAEIELSPREKKRERHGGVAFFKYLRENEKHMAGWLRNAPSMPARSIDIPVLTPHDSFKRNAEQEKYGGGIRLNVQS